MRDAERIELGADHKFRVLMLMAGPKFDLEWEFGDRLRSMSKFSYGDLLTTSSANREIDLGGFVVQSMQVGAKKGIWGRVAYLRRCIAIMKRAIRDGKPVQIVVAYDPLVSGVTGLVLAFLFKVRLVCEINGDHTADANYMHIASGYKRRVRKFLAVTLSRYVLRRADGIKLLFEEQLERLAVKPGTSQVVECFPNYVHTEAFRNLGDDHIVLLVGFPLFVKGVDIAIAAFRNVEKLYPHWKLKIMGFYPDRTQLNELIGDSQQIFIQKPVLHRDISSHIGCCSLLLQPSRTEAMGRVLVEAMAAGKPVISTNIDGIPTVVEDGVDGLLVPPDDVDATAAALRRLIEDPALRSELGNAGVEKVAAGLVGGEYFRRTQEMYQRVISLG